ncbi:hypothetical protein K449DRAFT_389681 [Hypoxylon sp. EC38]|nr:hypothetical protein K449DRAFT_389681 [Hypoxylon sp. EC38]
MQPEMKATSYRLQVTADNQTAVEKGTDLDTSDDFFTAVLEGRSDNAPPMARQCPLLDLSGVGKSMCFSTWVG